MGVAIDAEGKPRAVLLVRRGRPLELLEVDLRLGRVLRVVGLGRWLPRLVVWAPAIKVPTGVVRNVIIGGPTGRVVLADVDGDGEREVICTVDGEWKEPGPWLQVSRVQSSHVGCYLLVLDGRRGTYEAELVRMVWFAALRAAGDVDDDGRDELVLFYHLPPLGRLEPLLRVVKVDGGGLVTVAELPVEGWTEAWLVDVTGDGRPELLVGFGDTLTAYRFQGGEMVAVWRVKGWRR